MHFNLGAVLSDQRNFAKAAASYSKALQINPANSISFFYRAVAFEELNDYAKAIQDFTIAISLNGSYAHAIARRGAVLLKTGKKAEGQSDLRKAVTLDHSLKESNHGLLTGN